MKIKIIILTVVSTIIAVLLVVFVLNYKDLTGKKHFYKTELANIKNIKYGQPINYKGLVIGKISKAFLNDNKRFLVVFYIYEESFNLITSGSKIEVKRDKDSVAINLDKSDLKYFLAENSFLESIEK